MPSSKKTLSIIGCGKVGQTLGYLFAHSNSLCIQDVLNRSQPSADSAVAFIGQGRACYDYSQLHPANIYLIATPDDLIESACTSLAATQLLHGESIVFHCSGAQNAKVLHAAKACGAAIASVHPIRSFANPAQLISNFAGTYCGTEGDQAAIEILNRCFTEIGAMPVSIEGDKKVLYHAAAVFASNYLVTLLDVARQAYIASGIAPDMALKLMTPLVQATAGNVFRLGPSAALTGPIARGDMATVERQQLAVSEWNPAYGDLYREFVGLTTALAWRTDESDG